MFIVDFLKGYDSSFQAIVIEKLLGQNLMQPCVLQYLQDLGRIKENHFASENLKCGLSNLLYRPQVLTFCDYKRNCLQSCNM
jgi:hypothetical protein